MEDSRLLIKASRLPLASAPMCCLALLGLQFQAMAFAADDPSSVPQVQRPSQPWDASLDHAIANEAQLMKTLKGLRPVAESYIQELRKDDELGETPVKDHYFLGRMDLSHGLTNDSYIPAPGFAKRFRDAFNIFSVNMNPRGWMHMAIIDSDGFDRRRYEFSYVRREVLGDVRCLVFDVKPRRAGDSGRFIGRVWVEDHDDHIVRFDGTYTKKPQGGEFIHFDSWRVNCGPNLWVPAYAYSEEDALKGAVPFKKVRFKGQVRFWGYQTKADEAGEFTNLTVDGDNAVRDESETAMDTSPVGAVRLWERQAENNVVDRLQQAGLVSPPSEVDKVLDTVLNNLEVTNNVTVEPQIRVRVLLTTPLESVSVGHTILISRGLLDVLPDEACLAAVISHELAHILLGHKIDTKFAFSDRLLFEDDATLKKLKLGRTAHEETAADERAIALLQKSPYKDQLPQAGLFLRELSARADTLPQLVRPLLADRLVEHGKQERLSPLMETAPELRPGDAAQTAALPLGSRIKMDPWTDQLQLAKTRKVPLLTAREKLPLQVTPFMLRLTRESQGPPATVVGKAAVSPCDPATCGDLDNAPSASPPIKNK
jgi:Peptidase family M48